MRDTIGTLLPGDTLFGEVSQLKGNVRDVNRFSVRTTLGVTRDKVSKNDMEVGILNDFNQDYQITSTSRSFHTQSRVLFHITHGKSL